MKIFPKSNPKTYLYLMGGLGNQLFQVAAGLSFALNEGTLLVIDESFGNYRRNKKGKADLHDYGDSSYYNFFYMRYRTNFRNRYIGILLRLSLDSGKNKLKEILIHCLIKFNSVLLSKQFGDLVKIWNARNIGFEEISRDKKNLYLLGYFQTYKYASEKTVKSIMDQFSVPEHLLGNHKEIFQRENPLVVHIRLTDYESEPKFGVLSESYYEEAITLMVSKYGFKHISVFSDDIEKAKKLIPERYYGLCRWMCGESEPAVVTLEKMRWGSGYVIGNSSFSWWGAFLSHTKNAPTVAPKPWFADMAEPNELIPDYWIRVSRNGS